MNHLSSLNESSWWRRLGAGRRLFVAGCLVALAGGPLLRASGELTAGPALKVEVNTPPSWNLLIDDRVAEWFVDGVRTELARQGFDGQVEEVRFPEDPGKVPYLLTLNIAEWRIGPAGFIDCTLTASLHTPAGERRLGVYHQSLPRWMGGYGRWGLQRAFAEAADSVIADLCRDLARSEQLPGLRRIAA